jgi:hypothetical protein
MKNYIGISRDHSGSMASIRAAATKDYNSKIASIREATNQENQDTIVSVVECDSYVQRVVTNSNVNTLKPLTSYNCRGMTALYDSVGDLIDQFESVPDANDPNVSFLVMAITDGGENASRKWNAQRLAKKIRELTMTDRWTFVFRVPRGYSSGLARQLGLPEGNILEWDQTERGVATASKADSEAFATYFKARSTGLRSTNKFYTDLSNVSLKDVEVSMKDISGEVQSFPITKEVAIRPFIESVTGKTMKKGAGFYKLTRIEPIIQDYKRIMIKDKATQAIYEGPAARQMLGLPTSGNIRLAPGDHGQFDIYIQSTSVNRKLKPGTELLYWENA